MMAQARISDPGVYKCRTHQTETVSLCCQDCDRLICLKCVTSEHNGHKMCQMADVLQRKKASLQEIVKTLETDVISEIDQHIKSMSDVKDQTIIEITVKGDKLKRAVDDLQQQLISICNTKYSDEKVREQIVSMTKRRGEMLKFVSDAKDVLKRSRVPEVIESEREAMKKIKWPLFKENTIFVPSCQNSNNILDQFGALEHHSVMKQSYTKADICKPNEENFMLSAKEVQTLRYPFVIKYLVADRNDILASNNSDNTISKLKADNKMQKLLDVGGEFVGFGVCSQHGILTTPYGESGSEYVNIVRHVPGEDPKQLFRLSCPFSICVPEDGKVLFGNYDGMLQSSINLYHTESGRILHRYGIASYPSMIRSNKQTGDVGIVYNKERIFVLDRNLRPKFWYCGLVDSTPGEPDKITQNRMRSLFQPRDICFDKFGHILIADYASSNILALNSNGLLVKVVVALQSKPVAITVDNKHQMWVALENKEIKIFKYLK